MAVMQAQDAAPVMVLEVQTPQGLIDGQPTVRIYSNPAGTPNLKRGPYLYTDAYAASLNARGFPVGGPCDPTAPVPRPTIQTVLPHGQRQMVFGPARVLLEPPVFVPGTGWVSTAAPTGGG